MVRGLIFSLKLISIEFQLRPYPSKFVLFILQFNQDFC